MVTFWAWLYCNITRQPFRSFATRFYYATCRWEHGTTASSAGLLVNTANESPSHNFICSSSCTESQECCCERSEQQQTCIYNNASCYILPYLVLCWCVDMYIIIEIPTAILWFLFSFLSWHCMENISLEMITPAKSMCVCIYIIYDSANKKNIHRLTRNYAWGNRMWLIRTATCACT